MVACSDQHGYEGGEGHRKFAAVSGTLDDFPKK